MKKMVSKISIAKRGLVCGVGRNDADYMVVMNDGGKRVICKFYQTWQNMLCRCYSESYQEKQPTYKGCTVCEEWHSFMAFRSWMEKQDWEGKELDKDIVISGNKECSPKACRFVGRALNGLLNDNKFKRGDYCVGVSFDKRRGKFVAQCRHGGKAESLGYFLREEQAHRAYIGKKCEVIIEQANLQSDEGLRIGLMRKAQELRELVNKQEKEVSVDVINYKTVEEYEAGVKAIEEIGVDYEGFDIKRGDRIAQMVLVPVEQANLMVVAELDETERGAGGFGSTGK